MISRFHRVSIWAISAILFIAGVLGHAQSVRGTVTGTVSDQSGAVVQKATVTLTSPSTGVSVSTATNQAGKTGQSEGEKGPSEAHESPENRTEIRSVLARRSPPIGAFGRGCVAAKATRTQNAVDFAILMLIWLSFSSLATLHVVLAFAIGQRLGKPRGWLSLLVFPLAPYFGFVARVKSKSLLWCVLLLGYAALLFVGTR